MADTGDNTTEIQHHQSTYNGFTQMMYWGTAVAVGLGAFVVFLIAN